MLSIYSGIHLSHTLTSLFKVNSWSTFPFFPDRVVVGEQRIKRKKKKVKKKKKKGPEEVSSVGAI